MNQYIEHENHGFVRGIVDQVEVKDFVNNKTNTATFNYEVYIKVIKSFKDQKHEKIVRIIFWRDSDDSMLKNSVGKYIYATYTAECRAVTTKDGKTFNIDQLTGKTFEILTKDIAKQESKKEENLLHQAAYGKEGVTKNEEDDPF